MKRWKKMRTIQLKDILEKFERNVFDFDYDMDFNNKEEFERMFYRTYWFRNIGFETVDMFIWEVQTRVLRLAPMYNEINNILKGVELKLQTSLNSTETFTETGESEQSGEIGNESSSTGYSQELGYMTLQEVDFDNVNSAVRNINDAIATSNQSNNTNLSSVRELSGPEIPLHEAINNLKTIRVSVLNDMVDEFRDMFSLVYYF